MSFELDSLLSLEEQSYTAGFAQGSQDGLLAGKIEGRSVGLKTGFEKFSASGRLAGRAIVWANRQTRPPRQQTESKSHGEIAPGLQNAEVKGWGEVGPGLPALPSDSTRLKKNVEALYELLEPGTLSVENNDEAVADFDERFKRAQGKMKVIEKRVGEVGREKTNNPTDP